MKSLIDFFREVAIDSATWCCTSTSELSAATLEIERDVAYVARRMDAEGHEFLMISLPAFRRSLEQALDGGQVTDEHFVGFKRPNKMSKLPSFLGWFLQRIFHAETGALLDVVNFEAIKACRMLSGMFEKIELPCSDARELAALTNYVEIDKEVRKHDAEMESTPDGQILLRDFTRASMLLFASVFRSLDHQILRRKLIGKHGPGSTADRVLGNQKWASSTWHWRLEDNGFPYMDFLIPSHRFYKEAEAITFLEPGEEPAAKVVLVPKTLKTPRVIAMEPTVMQYAQQAVAYDLVSAIENDVYLGKMLGFNDQGPNQTMAEQGSVNRSLATLDLSEASDRVSNQLVLRLLEGHCFSSDAIQACRSTSADVPGHGKITLAKFASMGSALCFPIEAMVFLAVIFVAIEKAEGRQLRVRDYRALSSQVRVYGDDIIVPVRYVQSVVDCLEAFGLKVNQHKSFWTGRFRESCGKEFYAGYDVSYVKLRSEFPSNRTDVLEIISTVSTRNQLYFAGYWRAAGWLDERLSKILRHYPTTGPESPLLGRHSFLVEKQPTRYFCPRYHVPLEKGYRVNARIPVNAIDGYAALMKWFSKRGIDPFEDPNHLLRSGRPRVVSIKLAMAASY